MKKYGHTGTLFIQNGKYKWSYKYNYCISCGSCKNKHKGRGLCTNCFEKERSLKPRRKVRKLFISAKFNFKRRIKKILSGERKKRVYTKNFDNKKYKQEYSKKNRRVISLIQKAYRRSKKGFSILEMNFSGKIRKLPFETLARPKVILNNGIPSKEYIIWKKNMEDFELLKNFYSKSKNKI